MSAAYPLHINGARSSGGDQDELRFEQITVNGERGLWLNKNEETSWRGSVPIKDYRINQDPQPEVVTKPTRQRIEYVQELAIRYLRPPTPPPPGDIVIRQETNALSAPAPPLIIRQQPPRPATPPPLVIREAPPPRPPPPVGPKVITISGKVDEKNFVLNVIKKNLI